MTSRPSDASRKGPDRSIVAKSKAPTDLREFRSARDSSQRKLHILSVAYPLLPVTTASGGGAEQVLRIIESGLVEAGFRSTVVAAEGSQIRGTLLPTPIPHSPIFEGTHSDAQRRHKETIETALHSHDFDLIHYHGLDFLEYCPQTAATPELATLHLPLDWYRNDLFAASNVSFNFVSESQARTSTSSRNFAIIPNGIELNRYYLTNHKSDYLLWMGRICPEKGTHIALRVAHRLAMPLVIAGPVHAFPSHRTYFDQQVLPLLDNHRIYVGPVEGDLKAHVLSEALCLLVPSLAPETSSLVAMEAISSGTPVIAFRSGALPEVVDHEETGLIVDSEKEMIDAVQRTRMFSPQRLRARAEARFSSKAMITAYLELYRRLTT